MKAVIYTRVSTGKQGTSLESQEKLTTEYCIKNGLLVLAIYSDSMSASTSQRPEFIAAIDRAIKEKASLVVHSTSRFSRNTIDQLMIEHKLRKSRQSINKYN